MCPHKSSGQQLEKVIDLLVVVVCLLDLLVLSPGVAQKSFNELSLPGFREFLGILFEDAFDVAPLCASDPLQNVLFRLIALFQVNPVGVVVLVCDAFDVDRLLDNFLRALCMQLGEREREYACTEKELRSFNLPKRPPPKVTSWIR